MELEATTLGRIKCEIRRASAPVAGLQLTQLDLSRVANGYVSDPVEGRLS